MMTRPGQKRLRRPRRPKLKFPAITIDGHRCLPDSVKWWSTKLIEGEEATAAQSQDDAVWGKSK